MRKFSDVLMAVTSVWFFSMPITYALPSTSSNELHHFEILNLAGDLPVNMPIRASFLAQDINNETVESYSGSVVLSAVSGSNSIITGLSSPIIFSNGVWNGTVVFNAEASGANLTLDDGNGHKAASAISTFMPNVVKMASDFTLPYIYFLHTGTDAAGKSFLIWYNADLHAVEKVLAAGTRAADFSIHYADDRLYVSANGIVEVCVFDRSSKARLANLVLHQYVYRLGAGPSGLLVTEDDGIGNAYYCKLHLWNNNTGAQIQESASYSIGRGTGESDPSGRYYYHADSTAYPYSGMLRKYDLSSGRMVQTKAVSLTKGALREMVVSGDGTRLFYNGLVFDSELNQIGQVGSPVCTSSRDGELAVSSTRVVNGLSGGTFHNLPFSASAMAFTPDESRLVLFNPSSKTLSFIETADMIPNIFPVMAPTPTVGSVEAATLSAISWSGSPTAFGYDVYVGTDSNAVATATTNSAEYFGRQLATSLPLPTNFLAGSETYFWRVDQIGYGGTLSVGELWYFHTPAIAVVPDTVDAYAIMAAYTQSVFVAIDSFVDGSAPWSVSCPSNWLSFAETNGTAPGTLELRINATRLAAGRYSTVIEISDGTRAVTVPVALEIEKMQVVKMTTDWTLPYVYMAHAGTTGTKRSKLICYNTDTGCIEKVLDAGENITDLTVSYADNRIYVSNWQRAETRVFDRISKSQIEPLLLNDDVYKINAGRAGRIFTETKNWFAYMFVYDTTNGKQLTKSGIVDEGDGDCTLDGRFYYHCDNNSSGATIQKYDVTADTFAQVASMRTKYYYGSRNIFLSMDGNRVYNCGTIYDADLKELRDLKTEIYAASAYGDLVITGNKAYNGGNGVELYTLPFSASVMAFSGDQSKLLLFNSTSGAITSIATSAIMPIPEPNMIPVPAKGSVQGANLPELAWSGAPAAIGYDVYIGTDSNAVALASTNSAEYLGRRTDTNFRFPEGTLSGNETYFWRVDIVAFGNTIVGGDIWDFRTASIAVDPFALVVDGVTAAYTQRVVVAVSSTVAVPVGWTVSCTNDWLLLGASGGTGSGILDVGINLTGLRAGVHSGEIIFTANSEKLKVPVTLSVENMRIVKMATDWSLPYVYMAHTSTTSPYKSRLIWYNTDTSCIERVLDAGENVTDLTVSYADNRIYVSNWQRAETRVFDRLTKTELDPLLMGTDVYHINAGRAGRVYTEGEDQWVRLSARSTTNGSETAYKYSVREGDGDCTLDGRFYYHCDNNSSGASIQKYDVTADTFAQVASMRTKYYYGSRNLFLSMDGSRVYNCGTIYDSNLKELRDLKTEIYAASAYGDLVITGNKAYNGGNGTELYTLPFSTSVMAFSGDQSKLLLFNSTSGAITSIATSAIMPIPEPTPYLEGMVSLSIANKVYDGTACAVSVTTVPPNLTTRITYNGSTNIPANAGDYTVVSTICDTLYMGSSTGTVSIIKADQTISFPTIGNQLTTNNVGLSATASAGLAVTFNVASGPGSITDGTNLSFSGMGMVSVVALQSGNTNWNAATSVTNTFMVNWAVATVSLGSTSQTYNGSARVITATTVPSNLTVTVTYDGSLVAPTNAGNYAIRAVAKEALYYGSTTGTLVVAKADQTIGFSNIGKQEVTNTVGLSATVASGFDVAFSVATGPASILGGTNVSFSSAGRVAVLATQGGDSNWNPAPVCTNVFDVIGVITNVVPVAGTMYGGTEVTITGLWLGNGADITNVTLCDVAATIVTQDIHSVTVMAGRSPAATNADVVVQSAGFGAVTRVNGFTYQPIPPPPIALSAVDVAADRFTARWTAAESATNYLVDVSESTNFTAMTGVYSNWSAGNATAGLVAGLTDGVTYYYRVRAANQYGTSLDSKVIEVPVSDNTPYVKREITNGVASAGSSDAIDMTKLFYGTGMSYSVVSNSNPALVTAIFSGTDLTLNYATGVSGTARITIRVTDLSTGFWVENTIKVSVAPPPSLTLSPITLNRQNGLYEQTVTVSNTSPTLAAKAVTLTVTNLSAGARLYNATGTDKYGNSEIQWIGTLVPLGSMSFTLQYHTALRGVVPSATVLVSLSLEGPQTVIAGTVFGLSATYKNIGGTQAFLIEFSAVPGRTYYIQYTDSLNNEWKTAQPKIVAPVNRIQWIDSGPPGTECAPGDAANRFYRVIEAAE